ncbi:MAG: amidohydrolase family protein, partial [Emergencia timonensis]
MDTIFYNGKIYTEDRAYPICSAVAVKNGVIVALGADEEILKTAGPETEKIDLAGRLMLPGFVDTHLHMLFYAQEASLIDLTDCRSYGDVKRLCAERVAWAKENDKWVQGTGFNQDDWDVKTIPTRKDLDQITEDVPLTIRRTCHHITVCNTKAMETMGLLEEKEVSTQIN